MQPRPTPRPFTRLAVTGALLAAGLVAGLPSQANEPDARKGTQGVVIIELLTGAIQGAHPAVKVTRQPRDSDGDGFFEAGVQLDLAQYAGVLVEAEYADVVPTGITLNLGDSRTNNGFRGDSATQSNDAEAHAAGQDFLVWANDLAPREQGQLAKSQGIVQAGCVLQLEARDGFLRYTSTAGQGDTLQTPFLYALAGQADREGQVNHDLFLGLNCAVNGARRGKGLARVTIRPLN